MSSAKSFRKMSHTPIDECICVAYTITRGKHTEHKEDDEVTKVTLWTAQSMAGRNAWFSGNPDKDFGNCMWGPSKPTLKDLQEEHRSINSWSDVNVTTR